MELAGPWWASSTFLSPSFSPPCFIQPAARYGAFYHDLFVCPVAVMIAELLEPASDYDSESALGAAARRIRQQPNAAHRVERMNMTMACRKRVNMSRMVGMVADQLGHTLDVNQNVYTIPNLARRQEAVEMLEVAVS